MTINGTQKIMIGEILDGPNVWATRDNLRARLRAMPIGWFVELAGLLRLSADKVEKVLWNEWRHRC